MRLKIIIYLISILIWQGITMAPAYAENKSLHASSWKVIIETNMGSFTLQLNPEKAPKTVANFLRYVDQGFYTDTLFHRVIPRFVVQAGGFVKGLKIKQTQTPITNESDNGLLNVRGSISMARATNPDSATSQFFINLTHNPSLDNQQSKPGYAVFGKVTQGIEVIDEIANVATTTLGAYKDIPKQDVIILSAIRKGSVVDKILPEKVLKIETKPNTFIAGEHYFVFDKPIPTRDSNKIEIVEIFSYGCPHCYEFEPLINAWAKQQDNDVDFWYLPAVWNKSMELFAQAFYTAIELKIEEKIHLPLYTAIVIKHQQLRNELEIASFFEKHGVDQKTFAQVFNSSKVIKQAKQGAVKAQHYKPVGVPEIVVNGKYRIDRMRAGGIKEMLAVAEFLIKKERMLLTNK